MKKKIYVTCAIDYANGLPHLGHAIEKIGADAMVRYHRRKGEDVHFVIGMDEHGLKVMQSAAAENITPQQWVDNIAASFRSTWERLNISFNTFIRTTEPRHRRAVETMIARMDAAGDFYKAKYEGYYCVGCEAFKRQDELITVAGVHVRGHPVDNREQVIRCSLQLRWINVETRVGYHRGFPSLR